MPYRTQGIEDLPRLNTLSVPGLLRGMANTAPVQGPAVQRQELMDRIVAGLGDIPEAAVEIPESTGNMQALLEFLAAIGTGGLAAILAVFGVLASTEPRNQIERIPKRCAKYSRKV